MELLIIILIFYSLYWLIKPKKYYQTSQSPREFEIYCAQWLNRNGYNTALTDIGNDDNIDIYVMDERGDIIGIAECKRWKKEVGASAIKVLVATMLQKGYSRGWFFSLNGFSDGAVRYRDSCGLNISLIDGKGMMNGN